MSRPLFLVAVALLTVTPCSIAGPEDRPFAIFGYEDNSCAVWVNSQNNVMARAQYVSWFRGFISGYGFGSTNYKIPFDRMPDKDTLALFVDKYCRENPLKPFISSAVDLVKEIREKGQH